MQRFVWQLPVPQQPCYIRGMKRILSAALLVLVFASPAFAKKHYHQQHHVRHHHQQHHVKHHHLQKHRPA
jgi:hypothetical protein